VLAARTHVLTALCLPEAARACHIASVTQFHRPLLVRANAPPRRALAPGNTLPGHARSKQTRPTGAQASGCSGARLAPPATCAGPALEVPLRTSTAACRWSGHRRRSPRCSARAIPATRARRSPSSSTARRWPIRFGRTTRAPRTASCTGAPVLSLLRCFHALDAHRVVLCQEVFAAVSSEVMPRPAYALFALRSCTILRFVSITVNLTTRKWKQHRAGATRCPSPTRGSASRPR
jgi:hypothetical protein